MAQAHHLWPLSVPHNPHNRAQDLCGDPITGCIRAILLADQAEGGRLVPPAPAAALPPPAHQAAAPPSVPFCVYFQRGQVRFLPVGLLRKSYGFMYTAVYNPAASSV